MMTDQWLTVTLYPEKTEKMENKNIVCFFYSLHWVLDLTFFCFSFSSELLFCFIGLRPWQVDCFLWARSILIILVHMTQEWKSGEEKTLNSHLE